MQKEEVKKVIVIGAGGHGKVIADIVRASGDTFVGFLDDDVSRDVLGKVSDYTKFSDCKFIVGIGNTETRRRIALSLNVDYYTAIHPTAVVSQSAVIGEGTVVMPNVVINAEAIVGEHCIINTAAVVEHNDILEDFVHASVGVKIGGGTRIGKNTWLGIGSCVSHCISICSDCMIGAGAVVVNDITEKGTYMGVPAKIK